MSERTQQWFGLLGGAMAWFFHLFTASVIGESACILEGALFTFLGITAAGWLLIGVTITALVVCIASIGTAMKFRKDERESVGFMGRAGLISGLLSLLIILAQAAPIPILLNGC